MRGGGSLPHGMEDHYEGGVNLWEEVVDLQVKANP
jgi:hypothetical protein